MLCQREFVSKAASVAAYRLGLFGIWRRLQSRNRLTIGFYHDVVARSPLPKLSLYIENDIFRQHLEALIQHYRFVGMSDVAERRSLPRFPFMLTFDGYASTFLAVAKQLSGQGLRAVFYLQTEPILLGQPHWRQQVYFLFWHMPVGPFAVRFRGTTFSTEILAEAWTRRRPTQALADQMEGMDEPHELTARIAEQVSIDLQHFNETYRPLTPAEVKSLADLPGIEIGSHSHRHLLLDDPTERQVRDELSVSKQLLEEWTGRPVVDYAYPSGRISPLTLALLPRLGYRTAVTAATKCHCLYSVPEWPYLIPRFGMPSRPFAQAAGRLMGIDGLLERLAQLRRQKARQKPSPGA